MGTRSIIVVTGAATYKEVSTVRMYKHYDGYPSDVLNVLADALTDAVNVMKKHDEKVMRTGLIVGKIIGSDTGIYGPGARIDDDYQGNRTVRAEYDAALDKSHLGNQADLEWIYVVDADARNVSVYAGVETPAETDLNKTTDPYTQVNSYREESKEGLRADITSGIERLKAVGFSVNKKSNVKHLPLKKAK
ncbi:hypothetical protein UFOVP244_131 [uncultured Caudovirales phage]|uniref:Uncharacterized protein n=1 Tax=uncultured Caudovirales phage TaxID=2100421 RepID=A0A6J7WWN9_9CAUD|nr:hypothetical protein UFOVP244_131 [uncultured Caudovirales phage]